MELNRFLNILFLCSICALSLNCFYVSLFQYRAIVVRLYMAFARPVDKQVRVGYLAYFEAKVGNNFFTLLLTWISLKEHYYLYSHFFK